MDCCLEQMELKNMHQFKVFRSIIYSLLTSCRCIVKQGAASAFQGRRDTAVVLDRVTEFLLDLCCDGILHPPFYSIPMLTMMVRDNVSNGGQ
jgi:hypothetical protein